MPSYTKPRRADADGPGHRAGADGRRRPGRRLLGSRSSPRRTRPLSPASARRSPTSRAGRILDLACGPADITVRFARGVPGRAPRRPRGLPTDARARPPAGHRGRIRRAQMWLRAHGAARPRPRGSWARSTRSSARTRCTTSTTRRCCGRRCAMTARPGARLFVQDLHRPESPRRRRRSSTPTPRTSPRCSAATSSTRCAPRSPPRGRGPAHRRRPPSRDVTVATWSPPPPTSWRPRHRPVARSYLAAVGATRPPMPPVTGSGVATRRHSQTPSGGAVGGELVELPLLALGHPHVAQVDHVHREQERVRPRPRIGLERVRVGRDRGDVVVVQPLERLRRRRPGEMSA